ncbi:MAG TPA: glycosyltransferase family 2 protein [Vicinamibacterales bacterium]|nr:glycosyltransferase family 2 protein [Vicinamibacterales bacterium]
MSVVLPAYNEEAGIHAAVVDFRSIPEIDEVIVVNNRSSDRTEDEAVRAGATLVREFDTQGYGAALTRGLRSATGDLIILAEPDGTFVARDVRKLLAYADDFDMVCGTRTTPQLIWDGANMGFALRWGNTLLAKVIEFAYGGPSLSDCGCTLRLIHRGAWARMNPYISVTRSHFLPEMVILGLRLGVRMIEVPVNYRSRKGESKITGTWKGTVTTAWRMFGLVIKYATFRPA